MNQNWLPVADDVIRWHLSGRDAAGREFVVGVYPMLLDERCWFLAVDFDGEGWQKEVSVFMEIARDQKVPASLERSRSGNGGHVWLFFEEPVPATLARSLGAYLLTLSTAHCPQTKLQSYDRFFPNQDTLPRGGFGNLIALPLQKEARDSGNSIFIDEKFQPHLDQWEFLSSVKKLSLYQIEKLVDVAKAKGQIVGVRLVSTEENDEPWKAPPSLKTKPTVILTQQEKPKDLSVVLSDQIYLPKESLSPRLVNILVRLAAFQNPEFYKAQAMRLPTYDKPRIISCAEDFPQHIGLPRGCMEEMQALFKELKIPLHIDDQRQPGEKLEVEFHGTLYPEQETAIDALQQHDTGILAATTAFGKTVLAAAMIARRGVSTLILVHRKQLMDQWGERLAQFLSVEEKEIGRLGGGCKKLNGKLDVARLLRIKF
ncbi:MAG: DEAD/DEAH box helicase family protein [Verrucomicrobiales bacterium]